MKFTITDRWIRTNCSDGSLCSILLVVIASHKRTLDTPDTPDIVDVMDHYITVFDSLRKTAADTAEFKTAMRQKYPDYSGERILRASAAVVYGLFTLPY